MIAILPHAMSTSSHISIFSHIARITMLNSLMDTSASVTELSSLVDISAPEVSRHLSRLADHGFINRDPNTRRYEITSFGRTALQLYRPLEVLFNNTDYFTTHRLDVLPDKLLHGVKNLQQMEFIKGTGNVMLVMKELIDKVDKEIRLMVDQPFPFGKANIVASYLIPAEFPQVSQEDMKEIKIKGLRMLNTLPVAVAIKDDDEGLIFFQDNNETIDYSYGFRANVQSIEFIKAIWDHYWNHAKQIDFPVE